MTAAPGDPGPLGPGAGGPRREGPDLADAFTELARVLQAEDGAQATLARILDLAVATVPGCEHAGVSMVQDGRGWSPSTSGHVPALVDRLQYETGEGPCLDAIAGAEVHGSDDLATEPRWPRFAARAAREAGVRSILSLRLSTGPDAGHDAGHAAGRGAASGTLGALNLYSTRRRAFDATSRAVGRQFATHAAVGLRGALERERAALAVALQRSLLTDLPAPDHLQMHALYRPAAPGHEVGGDWYDAFVLPDGATALVVGDVTGHDVAAAASMGAVRNLLRGIAWDRLAPPSQVVARLDSALQGLRTEVTGTCVHARVEQTEADRAAGLRRLRWTNAGHLPPLLVAADGTVQVLTTRPELMLGVRIDAPRTDHEVPLPPGSTLLLHTDGLVERRGEAITQGLERLVRTLAGLAGAPLPDLLEQVVALAGPAAEDDTTALAVRLHPAPAP